MPHQTTRNGVILGARRRSRNARDQLVAPGVVMWRRVPIGYWQIGDRYSFSSTKASFVISTSVTPLYASLNMLTTAVAE